MKKRIYIGVCLLLPILAACNDWLDVSPKSEIKADELFETEAGFKDALTGLYIGMTDASVYGANLSWQEIEWMAGQYTETNNSFAELQRYNYESSIAKSFIEDVWLKEYNIIAEANLLLESLEVNGGNLNPTLYNVIKGEALAVRAMCHFDLIRLFAKGNLANRPEVLSEPCVPYVTAYSKETTGQLSYEATLELLHQDIEDALECLKSDPLYTGEVERPDDYDAVTDDIFFEGTYYKADNVMTLNLIQYPANEYELTAQDVYKYSLSNMYFGAAFLRSGYSTPQWITTSTTGLSQQLSVPLNGFYTDEIYTGYHYCPLKMDKVKN